MRTVSTSSRQSPGRDAVLLVLGPPRERRDPDAERGVGSALAHDEVGGEVAGAPRVAQRRGVGPGGEEGVAQGQALEPGDGDPVGRHGDHHGRADVEGPRDGAGRP